VRKEEKLNDGAVEVRETRTAEEEKRGGRGGEALLSLALRSVDGCL
jgi:hypothetical protein